MSVVSARPHAQPIAASPLSARLRRPNWRDRRLAFGAALVLVSALLGAHLLSAPEPGVAVWAARHDLPAGLALRSSDFEVRTVDLAGSDRRYVSATADVPSGVVLTRAVGAGELLPATAVAAAGVAGADLRTVTVPVERFHAADDLARGDRVDVYVTPSGNAGGVRPVARVLARGVAVVDVEADEGRFGGGGSARGIAVAVPPGEVGVLVAGLANGTVDVVRLSDGPHE